MPLVARKKIDPVWFTPDAYAEDEDPVAFKIKPLSGSQAVEVGAEVAEIAGQMRVTGHGLNLAIRYGLAGWRNYIDERGKEIKFNFLAAQNLPAEILSDLAVEIYEMSNLGEEEKKA